MFGEYPGDRSGTVASTPGGILAGSPTFSTGGSFHPFFYADFTTLPVPQTLTLHDGDSVMLRAAEDWTFVPEDPIARGRWFVRFTGTGSLAVADAYDLGYNYPSVTPTWTDQTSVGVASDLEYFTADDALLDESHLYDDGQPLVKLTCSGGDVDITFVGLQLEQEAGFFESDGGYVWSSIYAESTFEPPVDPSLGTYVQYVSGDDLFWNVDDTLVGRPVLTNIGGTDYRVDMWAGSGTSTANASGARTNSLADFHASSQLGVTESFADLVHVPEVLSIPETVPEHWDADLREKVTFYSAPTKAVLPNTTAEFDALPGWMRMLYELGFEWLDADSGFLGWHSHGGNYTFMGDGDSFTVYLQPVPNDFDSGTTWLDDADGFELYSETHTTVDPTGAADDIPAPSMFVSTDKRFVGRRVALDRRLTNALSFYTVENGYAFGLSGTTVGADENQEVSGRFRLPGWRYKIPTYTLLPGPASLTWNRQRGRGDGRGSSVRSARGHHSRLTSPAQRGYH